MKEGGKFCQKFVSVRYSSKHSPKLFLAKEQCSRQNIFVQKIIASNKCKEKLKYSLFFNIHFWSCFFHLIKNCFVFSYRILNYKRNRKWKYDFDAWFLKSHCMLWRHMPQSEKSASAYSSSSSQVQFTSFRPLSLIVFAVPPNQFFYGLPRFLFLFVLKLNTDLDSLLPFIRITIHLNYCFLYHLLLSTAPEQPAFDCDPCPRPEQSDSLKESKKMRKLTRYKTKLDKFKTLKIGKGFVRGDEANERPYLHPAYY